MCEASHPIGIVGAGSVGTILAAHLERAGRKTILVESGPRFDEVETSGLVVSGCAELHEKPWRLTRCLEALSEAERSLPRVWCLCTKTWSVPGLVPSLKEMLPNDVRLVRFQNGIGADDVVSARLGRQRVLCTVVNFAGGRAEHDNSICLAWFNRPNYIGACEGQEAAARQVAAMLTDAGLETVMATTTEIRTRLFYKTVLSAGLNALCAVTNVTMRQAMSMPHTRSLARALVREALEVGKASGYQFGDDALENAMAYLDRGGEHRPSMAVDLARGDPTEIELINGKLVELAEAFPEVSVDANRFVTALVVTEEIKNGTRRPEQVPRYLVESSERPTVVPAARIGAPHG